MKHLLKHKFFLSILLLLACHQTRIVPVTVPRYGQTRMEASGLSKSYIFGYLEGAPFRADCQEGIQSIRISRGIFDTLVQVLIGGIVSTRSVDVHCTVPHLNVTALDRSQLVRLQGVYFDKNTTRLHRDSNVVLDELAAYLKSHPTMVVRLSSHTDLGVPYPANERLSLARAAAVKEYLAGKGVGDHRIMIEGRGGQFPIAWALDDASSYLNDRIEAVAWNGTWSPGVPAQRPADPPNPLAGGEAEITMLDGSTMRGRITNQAGDHIQAILNGQSVVIPKEKIKLIQYGRTP